MSGKKQPVSLYIHVPFCTKKCPYCHFFVVKSADDKKDFFTRHLLIEWQEKAKWIEDYEVVSVYFGGGTPSLLEISQIDAILLSIQKHSFLSYQCEITIEANPELVSLQQMQQLHAAGINRVSIGVQSFDDTLLHILGRTHNGKQASKALQDTWNAGIRNISIDLMYEIPHQTLPQWQATVNTVASLPITHLSLYNLTIEPNTPFYRKKTTLLSQTPSQETSLAMLQYAVSTLDGIGLQRYEISAFAKNNLISIHNTGYWTGRPFLGLGPAAFSYFHNKRFCNIAHLSSWGDKVQKGLPAHDFEELLDPEHRQKELLAIGLRLLQGVDIKKFVSCYGPLSQQLQEGIQRNIREQYLLLQDHTLRLTDSGLLFYDTVAQNLM